MEEETNVNKYIVTQKLPREMTSKKKVVESLVRVTNLPALGQNDITDVSVQNTLCARLCEYVLFPVPASTDQGKDQGSQRRDKRHDREAQRQQRSHSGQVDPVPAAGGHHIEEEGVDGRETQRHEGRGRNRGRGGVIY